MIKTILILLTMLTSVAVISEEIERTENLELEFVLNNLVWNSGVKRFDKYDFEARLYKTSSMDSCAILMECRPFQKLYIATTEGDGGEGPVKSIYQLLNAHIWEVMEWDESKPEIKLKSTIHMKNGTVNYKTYLLKLTYLSATLEAL